MAAQRMSARPLPPCPPGRRRTRVKGVVRALPGPLDELGVLDAVRRGSAGREQKGAGGLKSCTASGLGGSICRWQRQRQRSAHRGVSASVHSGNLVCGGKSQSVHSKQGVTPGMSTLRGRQ